MGGPGAVCLLQEAPLRPGLAALPCRAPGPTRTKGRLPVDDIARLVAHVDEAVALFDEALAETHPRPSSPEAKRHGGADETRDEPWVERFDRVSPCSSSSPYGRVSVGWRLRFDGPTPKQWTPARAEIETGWSSRDAITNAVGEATAEGTPDRELAGRAAAIYGGWLERRAALVDSQRLRPLLAGAIRDAMRGDSHAGDAVKALRHEWARLFDDDFDGDCRAGFTAATEWMVYRRDLVAALENARLYAVALAQKAEGAGDGEADDIGRIARQLTPKAREVILYMYDMGAFSGRDKLTRAFIADGLDYDIDSLVPVRNEFRQYEMAFDRKLYDAKDGRSGGWWLEPDGKLVAERLKTGLLSGREQAATPSDVRLA